MPVSDMTLRGSSSNLFAAEIARRERQSHLQGFNTAVDGGLELQAPFDDSLRLPPIEAAFPAPPPRDVTAAALQRPRELPASSTGLLEQLHRVNWESDDDEEDDEPRAGPSHKTSLHQAPVVDDSDSSTECATAPPLESGSDQQQHRLRRAKAQVFHLNQDAQHAKEIDEDSDSQGSDEEDAEGSEDEDEFVRSSRVTTTMSTTDWNENGKRPATTILNPFDLEAVLSTQRGRRESSAISNSSSGRGLAQDDEFGTVGEAGTTAVGGEGIKRRRYD